MTDTIALSETKNRFRSDRHATSYPLVTVGAIGFHYISADFYKGPVSWIYGLPRPLSSSGRCSDEPNGCTATTTHS